MRKFFVGILIFGFLKVMVGIAQDNQIFISLDVDQKPIKEVFTLIETLTPVHFYYKESDLDSVFITEDFQAAQLSVVLDKIIRRHNLHYAIDRDLNIFVTKHFIINTTINLGSQEQYSEKSIKRVLVERETRGNKMYEIGNRNQYVAGAVVSVSGVIKNAENKPIPEVSIEVKKLGLGTITNQAGEFTLTLPAGWYEFEIRHVGMERISRLVMVYTSGIMDIELQESIRNLEEVVVQGEQSFQVKSVSLGIEQLNINTLKYVPTVFGEADVLRVILTLPGVKSVGEVSTGFNVRGGASDQNLILLNDATIYNPTHFFGFFSAFNSELIDNVELFKSSIPAKYGGRLSSVLQVISKEGNNEKIRGSAGIGLITTRFNVDGPISKDRTHFSMGLRTTYSNWLFKLLPEEFRKSKASFYDVNINGTHHLGKNSSLKLTTYLSHNESNLNTDTIFQYNNRNISLKFLHDFNSSLSFNITVGKDHYDYNNRFTERPPEAYALDFKNNQLVGNFDFNYTAWAKHALSFGLRNTYYTINPGYLSKASAQSNIAEINVPSEQALETGIYIEDQYSVSDKLAVTAGFRYNLYNYLGPHEVRIYTDGVPRTTNTIAERRIYRSGKVIKTYQGLDVRLSGRYGLTSTTSIKAGFTSTHQFIHMLSNTVAISPTDIWKLSDPNIRPQQSNSISAGIYKSFNNDMIQLSGEAYLKQVRNYLDYKSGATIIANPHIETEVFTTKGKSYGVEFVLRKNRGHFNGWASYTYSRALLRVYDQIAGETINNGQYYPANYDKPHDVTIVANERFTKRISMATTLTYSTGRPITIPTGVFYYGNSQKTLYSDRNGYRLPDYFRADLSINIEGNHKTKQLVHNYWTFGVYNLTGRKNPYSIYFTTENGIIKGYRLSIFGSLIPFINYNIKF